MPRSCSSSCSRPPRRLSGGYAVRAIFDDAGNLIPGENVKIDGVKVGTVSTVTPTPEAKAAVVIDIENPGFQDFRADANCEIRPQSLIGEKYVDCLPTQPRVEGAPLPPPLQKIPGGREGAGSTCCPCRTPRSPVDVDLLGDIQRLPERERFTLILNELGAGLAGRGSDLNEVVKRANPALRELDRVLEILANENHVLAKLAVDSDQALAPLAKCAAASPTSSCRPTRSRRPAPPRAARSRATSRCSRRSSNSSGRRSNASSASPNRRRRRSPTSRSPRPGSTRRSRACPRSRRATKSSSKTSARPRRSPVPRSTASGRCSNAWKRSARRPCPFTNNFSQLFESLQKTGGLERIMDFIFLGTGSANGYDSLGHFLRAEGAANACLIYTIAPSSDTGCRRKLFNNPASRLD